MTRLLNNPIVARAGLASTSSSIDMLGGDSPACTCRIPPCFCARTGALAYTTASIPTAARMLRSVFILLLPELLSRPLTAAGLASFTEPDVFHAPAVVDAVGHQGQVLDPGLAAGGAGRVVEHRPDTCLGEDAFDLPHGLFALYRV